MEKQSLNLNAELFGGFTGLFMKIIFAVIIVYVIIMVLSFLRDKFINKEVSTQNVEITDLLTILNKLFYISGFGFIIGNILQEILEAIPGRSHSMNFGGEWNHLTFGIILIFMGIGFKYAKR